MYLGYDTRADWPSGELAVLISALKPGRALDLGTGHGTDALFLASHGWRVVAIDTDKKAIREARRRADKLGKHARRRLTWVEGDATRFAEREAGTFDLVVERLVYQNLFRQPSDGLRPAGSTYRRRRRDLLLTAARALQPGKLLVLRTRPEVGSWGRVASRDSRMGPEDLRLAAKYFSVGKEVGFKAIVTAIDEEAAALVVAPMTLALCVLTRNGQPLT